DPFADPPDPFADPAPIDSASAAVGSSFDPSAVDPLPPPRGLEIHGRINGTVAFSREEDTVEQLKHTSFGLSAADLYAAYYPTRWFGALAELELEQDLGDGDRFLALEVDLLAVELRPFSNDRLLLRLGHQPVTFGLERRFYAPPRNELANRPAAFRRVYPGTYSDTGAFLWARQSTGFLRSELELELSLTRGLTGPDRDDKRAVFSKDNNSAAQWAGRLGWTVVDLDPTRRGAQGIEAALPTSLRFAFGASFLNGEYDRDARRRVRFYGFDAELRLGGLLVRGELVVSEVESEVPDARTRRGTGTYVLAAYHWRLEEFLVDELYVAFRYGRADRDQRVSETLDVERYHVGLGWVPHPGFLAKVGYEWTKGRGDPGRVVYLELGFSF
ncbi:MAG: hypothetical protein KDD82_06755, partial [Planctomycetes bacterium]|nr:hypothetical protein [Planctomycetota bacterium]